MPRKKAPALEPSESASPASIIATAVSVPVALPPAQDSSARLSLPLWFHLLHSLDQLDKKRTAMSDLVTNFFSSLIASNQFDDIAIALHLFDNSIAPPETGTELGLGEALLQKALARFSSFLGHPLDPKQTKDLIKECGDTGEWASKHFTRLSVHPQDAAPNPAVPTLAFLFESLHKIAQAEGTGSQERKVLIVQRLLQTVLAMENGILYTVRTLQSKLRIGITSKTIVQCMVNAIVQRHLGPKTSKNKVSFDELATSIAEKCTAFSNFDRLVQLAHISSLADLKTSLTQATSVAGQPVQSMLAKPTTSVQDVLAKFDGSTLTAEFKYDGERAQVHWIARDRCIQVFSRNGESSTAKYSFLQASIAACLKDPTVDQVFDGEMVAVQMIAVDEGESGRRILPFQSLAHLSKKGTVSSSAPTVMFVAFDMLLLGSSDLMNRQFAERRICLEHSVEARPGVFELASALTSQDPDEILQFLDESIAHGCEGLMIKSAESVYEPSKRSTSWLKLKKDYIEGIGDTLDLVPIGAWLGKGKRHGAFGSYLLACYNADKQTFESIARVGTGLSDEHLDTFWKFLNETGKCRQDKPDTVVCSLSIKPDVWIVPSSVWEIKAADLTLSPVHSAAQDFVAGSGVSLRFPRFVRVRDDKGIQDATTSRQVMQMYLEQASVKGGK